MLPRKICRNVIGKRLIPPGESKTLIGQRFYFNVFKINNAVGVVAL